MATFYMEMPADQLRVGESRVESPVVALPFSPAALVPSWEITTPAGSQVTLLLRVGDGSSWSDWRGLATWSLQGPSQSHAAAPDAWGELATDTYRPRQAITQAQLAVELHAGAAGDLPTVRALHLAAWCRPDYAVSRLPVPARSQMVYPEGGRVWCSPTSLSMVLAYWAERLGRPELVQEIPAQVVPRVYDTAYDGYGNWPFNTAYAAAHGLRSHVRAFDSLDDLAPWLRAGVPVICSVAYDGRWLENAPIGQTGGHLLVVTGIDADGHILVNDPAGATDGDVERVYRRDQFMRAWLRKGVGVVYLVHPPGWPLPR